MRNKVPFIASITDITKVPFNTFVHIQKKDGTFSREEKIKYRSSYENRRWAIYCPCNTRLEIDEKFLTPFGNGINIIAPIKCSCGIEYNNKSILKQLHAKSIDTNTVEKRFSIVERKNSFALYSFSTYVLVSSTTKNLIFKDVGDYSIYLSKTNKAIRLRKGKKVITVPMKRIVRYVSDFLRTHISNVVKNTYMPDGMFCKKIVEPLEKFCQIIESFCHPNDVNRILDNLKKERDEFYFKCLFLEKDKSYNNTFEYNGFQYSFSNDIGRDLTMTYFEKRLSLMLGLFIFPPFATIALNYGNEKLLKILNGSSLMCSLTQLKKKNPTKPKEIIETLFKGKLLDDNIKIQKLGIFEKKQNEKLKRLDKKINTTKDEVKLLELKTKKDKIISSKTNFTPPDSRVPKLENFKKVIKNFDFNKNYVNLFLNTQFTFDDAVLFFYNIISKDSMFENGIETLNKVLDNIKEEDQIHLIELSQNYTNNLARMQYEFSYNEVINILKLFRQNELKNKRNLLHEYQDTIKMLVELERPISATLQKIKTYEQLHELHEQLTKLYKLNADKNLDKKIAKCSESFRDSEVKIDNIEFQILDSVEKLYNESEFMHHCVKTYCYNVADGSYVIYGIKDIETGDRATLAVITRGGNFSFNQLKTINNRTATKKIIETTRRFLRKYFRLDNIVSHDLNPIEEKKEENIVIDFDF
jgi:hypothetical protein